MTDRRSANEAMFRTMIETERSMTSEKLHRATSTAHYGSVRHGNLPGPEPDKATPDLTDVDREILVCALDALNEKLISESEALRDLLRGSPRSVYNAAVAEINATKKRVDYLKIHLGLSQQEAHRAM